MVIEGQDKIYSGEFNDKKDEYEQACFWLQNEFGINYKQNRYGLYIKDLRKFINPNNKELPKGDLIEHFHTFIQSTTEAYQLIRIWRTFKSSTYEGLSERIKKIVKGQASRKQAIIKKGSNDVARDFAFELSVASRFSKAGYEIDLNQVADVVVSLNKSTLFVECKRVTSEAKLYTRIKEAVEQIDTRIGSDRKNKHGFVAIDVTDLIDPSHRFHAVFNEEQFLINVKSLIQQFVLEREERLIPLLNRNVVGFMFEYSSAGLLVGGNEPKMGYSRAASVLHTASHKKNEKVLYEFYGKIGNQNL